MFSKEHILEIEKNQKLSRFIISLIRNHYEPSDKDFSDFKKTTDEIIRYFEENNQTQLAEYVSVLNGNDPYYWIPMEEEPFCEIKHNI